jgi:hypothetical protein
MSIKIIGRNGFFESAFPQSCSLCFWLVGKASYLAYGWWHLQVVYIQEDYTQGSIPPLCYMDSFSMKQVRHSKCSLKENPKFFQNLRSKNNTLREHFWLIFLSDIAYCNAGLAFIVKSITSQNCIYFIRGNSQNLPQQRKWALWMRHLVCRVLSWDQS